MWYTVVFSALGAMVAGLVHRSGGRHQGGRGRAGHGRVGRLRRLRAAAGQGGRGRGVRVGAGRGRGYQLAVQLRYPHLVPVTGAGTGAVG